MISQKKKIGTAAQSVYDDLKSSRIKKSEKRYVDNFVKTSYNNNVSYHYSI